MSHNTHTRRLRNSILSIISETKGCLELRGSNGTLIEKPRFFRELLSEAAPGECGGMTLVRGVEHVQKGMTVLVMGGEGSALSLVVAHSVGETGEILLCDTGGEGWAERDTVPPNTTCLHTPEGNLTTNFSWLQKRLAIQPPQSLADYTKLTAEIADNENNDPAIPDGSVDIAIVDLPATHLASKCYWKLFPELFRVLKRKGTVVVSIHLSDEFMGDGSYLSEDDFHAMMVEAGFYGLHALGISGTPHRVVDGKEIRCWNFVAFKGKEGACMERNQAVLYKGPWSEVRDDDGHIFPRGKRVAVCNKTFAIMSSTPYAGQFEYIEPYVAIAPEDASPFPCSSTIIYRHPATTKTGEVVGSPNPESCCGSGEASSCC